MFGQDTSEARVNRARSASFCSYGCRFALLVFVAALAGLVACGCNSGAGLPAKETGESNLADLFTSAGGSAQGGGSRAFDRHFPAVRDGVTRDSMIFVAPVSASAPLDGFSGSYMVEANCTQVFNIGDGIQMDIYLLRQGQRRKIFSRYFDAGRKAEDRAWLPIRIPLDLLGPDRKTLEIDVSAGPQGDLVADWLAISSMRLVPLKESR